MMEETEDASGTIATTPASDPNDSPSKTSAQGVSPDIESGTPSRPQIRSSNSVRRTSNVDMGDPEGVREKLVTIVNENETKPMNAFDRKGQELRRLVRLTQLTQRLSHRMEDPVEETEEKKDETGEKKTPTQTQSKVQYRLKASRSAPTNAFNRFLRNFGCGCCLNMADDSNEDQHDNNSCFNPNKMLYDYLFWSFRTSFLMLFLSTLFAFFALILIFAGLMMIVGVNKPQCFTPDFDDPELEASGFALAFSLSWTTFSTVGYGHTYPALTDQKKCGGLSFLASMESFVGVLYAGFCGAILFGKVLRIQSRAPVQFCDPVVIRYGSGAESDDAEATASDENIPCPVLEFRLANTLFNDAGGEIMDAALNCVAMLDAKAACKTVRDSAGSKDRYGKKSNKAKKIAKTFLKSTINKSDTSGGAYGVSDKDMGMDSSAVVGDDHQEFDEDATSGLGAKLIFSKLTLESPEHPYFKRVWTVRHVMDISSPLLTSHARRLIKNNDGYWPPELNSYQGVKDNIQFNQLAVTFSGVSSVSAASVYAKKIYDFVDINVGYQFVSLLYRNDKDKIMVDLGLINDVMEQNGGGGEPLVDKD